MAIVTISNYKGGVAKTTTAVNLAETIARMGVSTCLYDTDHQATATDLILAKQYKWEVVAEPRRKRDVEAEILALSQKYEVVVVDTRPELSSDTLLAIKTSDLVIVPIVPGGNEVQSLAKYYDEILPLMEKHPKIRFRCMFVRTKKRSIMYRNITKLFEEFPIRPYKNEFLESEDVHKANGLDLPIWGMKRKGLMRRVQINFKLLAEEVVEELLEIGQGE